MKGFINTTMHALGQTGYFTKGVIYSLVGLLSLHAALTIQAASGTKEVILMLEEQPFGWIIMSLLMVGLFAYALWRFGESFLDAEDDGEGPKGIITRLGYIGSGLAYAAFGVWIAKALVSTVYTGNTDKIHWTRWALSQPWGKWAMGAVGAIYIGVSLDHLIRAYKANFMKEYKKHQMNTPFKKAVKYIGQFGQWARACIFLIIGGFLVVGAVQVDADNAIGIREAFEYLADQRYGSWLLGIVSAGFLSYGIYCFTRAGYKDFSVE